MNYKKINQLVKNYMIVDNTSRRGKILRQALFDNIMYEYTPLIKRMFYNINNYIDEHEFIQEFACLLLEAINKFDPKKASFNGYFYFYVSNLRHRIFKDKYSTLEIENFEEDDSKLKELEIDLDKILAPEEVLIFNQLMVDDIERRGATSLNKKINTIISKIKEYLKE